MGLSIKVERRNFLLCPPQHLELQDHRRRVPRLYDSLDDGNGLLQTFSKGRHTLVAGIGGRSKVSKGGDVLGR